MKSHLNDKPTCCLPLRPQSRHSDLWYFGAQLLSLQPCCLRLAHYITVTHSRLASNAVVSSLFDRISTCRIARPLLDARSGTRYSMSCYAFPTADCFIPVCFNALMGLSCYTNIHVHWRCKCSFNALMGLSCYS